MLIAEENKEIMGSLITTNRKNLVDDKEQLKSYFVSDFVSKRTSNLSSLGWEQSLFQYCTIVEEFTMGRCGFSINGCF